MIVVDASAMVEFLLQTVVGQRVEARVSGNETLHAPHLLDVEVLQALRRLVRMREVTPIRAHEALDDLRDFGLYRHGHVDLLERAWRLRDNLTAYDAMYVALAEALDATVITCDAPLAATTRHQARFELIQ